MAEFDGSAMPGNVVVVGSANLDLVVQIDRHPHPGETVLGGDLRRHPGGKGANQAVAAAKAGGARTVFVGALGEDDAAQVLLASLGSAGVDTSVVQRTGKPSGVALISVSRRGENSIIVAPGANHDVHVDDAARFELQNADVILAQLEIPIDVVLEAAQARHAKARFILNAAPSRQLPREVWEQIDVLVVNEHEAVDVASDLDPDAGRRNTSELGQALVERVPAVVITLGSGGCLVAERGAQPLLLPAPRVKAVDTTGAGDTFCGVLAAALASGQDLPQAVRLASAAGALAVTRRGAQESVPTAQEARDLADKTYATPPAAR
jgi:ribokinase